MINATQKDIDFFNGLKTKSIQDIDNHEKLQRFSHSKFAKGILIGGTLASLIGFVMTSAVGLNGDYRVERERALMQAIYSVEGGNEVLRPTINPSDYSFKR